MHHDQKIMAMFDMALSFLYSSQLNDALFKVQKAKIQERGKADGLAAASWVFDGNTTDVTYRFILKGINDGDPEILDSLSHPHLNGEYADDPTWKDIVKDELGIDIDDVIFNDSEWLDAYEASFDEAVQEEVKRACLVQLGMGSIKS